MSEAAPLGSFRLADTSHGSAQTFPLQFPLVGVLLAEQQRISWFCYKDPWQGWQLNSGLGVSESKAVLSRICSAVFSVCCLVNSDKSWRAGNVQ